MENTEKQFICECGKIFTHAQSFNGHKAHCKEHQIHKYGSLDYYNSLKPQKIATFKRSISKTNLAKQTTVLQNWILEQHTCECCNKIMTIKYGSGRFCSSQCAHSHKQTPEQNLSRSNKLKKTRTQKYCKCCSKLITNKSKTGYCSICVKLAPEFLEIRKQSGKKAYATSKNNNSHVGWQSRKIMSFPEQFWQRVLDENNIVYEGINFPIKREDNQHYFLDFYLVKNNKKIDLEIDGKQHQYKENKKHDIIRNNYLENLNYIIYRIPWNEVNSLQGKQQMQEKIDQFLIFYASL